MNEELLKLEQVAEMLNMSYQGALKWFHQGMFPNATRIGKLIRIPASDVEALKRAGKAAS